MMTDKMNNKNFGILDIDSRLVAASAGFMYKGFIISMSQVFSHYCDVAVFVDDAPDMVYKARSVEDAIEWCNKNQA